MRRHHGTRRVLWGGMVLALALGLGPYDTQRRVVKADEPRAHTEAISEAKALVASLEEQVRSSTASLARARHILAQLEKTGTAQKDETDQLEGVWRIAGINGHEGGKFVPATYDEYRIMSAGHYLWLSFDPKTGKVRRSGGGVYSVKNGQYTAWIESSNASDLYALIGQPYTGTSKVEGKKWYLFGHVPNGAVFDELWERVN